MKRFTKTLAALAILLAPAFSHAENVAEEGSPEHPLKLKIAADTRMDFDYQDFSDAPHESGFHGRYLNFILDGSINDKLSFHLRQRLNKFGEMRNDVFGATDWVHIDWTPRSSWTFSAGKQVVAIGGYEYDRNPINIYYASMFWNNIACYQFGVSATWHVAQGKHNFLAQICNSPYQAIGESCYASNLMWMGAMGRYSTIWSANLMEYERGKYGNIIALGNKVQFDGVYAELDYINRYWGKHSFFGDFSLIGKVCANIGKVDIFAKGGYEKYRITPGSDGPSVDKPFYGGGVEYFPLRGSRDLRLHAVADVTHDGATGARCTEVGAGLMWRVTLFNRK